MVDKFFEWYCDTIIVGWMMIVELVGLTGKWGERVAVYGSFVLVPAVFIGAIFGIIFGWPAFWTMLILIHVAFGTATYYVSTT